jgi:small subunit ribosomal protein S9
METVNALGRRKEAVARVYVNEGAGQLAVDGKDTVRIGGRP